MSLSIGLEGEDTSATISLPGPFELSGPGSDARRLDPETQSWDELAVLLALRDERITRACASRQADLSVEFSTGRVLSALSEGEFENWEVQAPTTRSSARPAPSRSGTRTSASARPRSTPSSSGTCSSG